MLLLTSTSDKIQLILNAAVNVDVHASYMDYNGTTVTPGRLNSKPATAATFDIVTSPGSSVQRNVKTLHIHNVHASSSVLATVQHTDGTNVVKLEEVTLLAGERLSYVEGVGFMAFDVNAIEKTNAPIPVGQYTVSRLLATVSNSTTTAAKVTGLDLVCGIGAWVFEYFLRFQSATGTVGFKLGCNHTGTVTTFDYTLAFPTTGTADSTGTMNQAVSAAATVMACLSARAKSTTAPLISTGGVDTTASDILVLITGLAIVTVAGNIELYHASETATSTSIMLDSVLRLTRMG